MCIQRSELRRFSLYAATLATAAFLLNGCGGSDGSSGANGTNGTNGTSASTATQVSALTAAQWASTTFNGEVTSVTIASPPVVNFKVTDGNGLPVVGLGSTSKSATATVASYPNLAFSLVKLVPGSEGSPSKWVSYIVTTVPSTTTAATASRPSTDNTGTLVDNGDGTYQYTFYRDVTTIKAQVAALTLTSPNVAADLGDLTYDPTLTHRLAIQISGVAPGTGTNTPTGVKTITSVPLATPVNFFYDFIPSTGKPVTVSDTQREIVKVSACFECHSKFQGFHNTNDVAGSPASRQDTRMCVVCHTEQRKYGRTEAVLSGTALTGTSQSRLRDFSLTNLPTFVHKIHMGHGLTLTNYTVAGVKLNEVTYPQPITNCAKCHTASTDTPQGDNWKNVPSRLACGSCHDGIDFATGLGISIAGDTHGHIGGAKADDKQCIICHDAAAISTVYHVTVDPTGANGRAGYPLNTAADVPTVGYASGQGPAIPLASQLNLPAGVYKIDFEIKQVTVAGASGAKKATVVYRILKDGLPVTLNTSGYLMTNVDGTPDIYIAYAMAQDGLATPADWNTTVSAHVIDIRNSVLSKGTQTGPDANGYYTATLAATIPDAAKMVTAALGVNYNGLVQLGLSAYPNGIRLREPAFAMKLANGYTARRSIVSAAKCNNCHGQLGVGPSFHGGARNNGEGCAICHDANKATGHIGAANDFGGGWNVGAKNMVHSIHSAAKREQAFTYEATADNPNGFQEVTYPGVLNNCEQCHVAGSYDFSATANNAALPNLLWSTEAKGDMSNPSSLPSIGLSPWVTSLGNGQVSYTADNLVTSPISSACFGCHDSNAAVAHMQLNGGSLYAPASTVSTGGLRTNGFNKVEACIVCHGTGKVADIKTVHAK